jgi:hypothetical protein
MTISSSTRAAPMSHDMTWGGPRHGAELDGLGTRPEVPFSDPG